MHVTKEIIAKVVDIAEPILEQHELSLFDVEYVKERNDMFLRVYIDKEGGVDLNDCSLISEELSEKLDEEDPIKSAYMLEVSSPGAERPLKTKKDFQSHINENIYVSLYVHIEGEKEYEGTLISLQNDIVTIEYKYRHTKKQVEIPFDKIAKARLAMMLQRGIKMSSELFDAINYLESEKGIDKEILIEALEAALISAYKKNFQSANNVSVKFDEEAGAMDIYARKTVVEEVENELEEISLEEAREINLDYELDDIVEIEVTPKNFGRIAAQAAKQVVTQRVREAERGIIYSEYVDREEDVMTGIIQRVDGNFVHVDLGKIEAKLAKAEQIATEEYRVHDRIKVFVTKVENTNKGPQIYISR